jgi:hypothetical protein
MDRYDLILSTGPSLIAIALQKWGFPSNKALATYARNEQERVGLPPATATLIENNLIGAVAENNLAVTFVSFPSGAFALYRAVHDKLHDDIVYLYIIVVGSIVVGLSIMNMIGGRSLHDIVTGRFRSFRKTAGKRFLPWSPLNVINWAIYGVNGILITTAIVFYLG